MQFTIDDISHAYDINEIDFSDLFMLIACSDYCKNTDESVLETPLTKYFDVVNSDDFKKLSKIEKARFSIQQFKLIELDDAINIPERYKLYRIMLKMWRNNSLNDRKQLKIIISKAPLLFGVWKAIKKIFKEAEAKNDTDMLGAISARIDIAYSEQQYNSEVGRGTIIYLVRRAWRYLRNIGKDFPSFYCQSAVDFLKAYPENINWKNTWVLNHIFFHKSKKYNSKNFEPNIKFDDFNKYRAFPDLWKKSPNPLIRLLEESKSSYIFKFAVSLLKNEHLINLREISEITLLRLLKKQSPEVDEFCIWIFNTVPKFEQSKLKEFGLHDAIINLFKSTNSSALNFVATYARTHAKDLPLNQVIELINHENKEVRDLAISFIMERDPRKDIGLDSWAKLLGTKYGNLLAEEAIIKNFSSKELTKEWFYKNLLESNSRNFSQKNLLKIHKIKDLGINYFIDIFNDKKFSFEIVNFVLENIKKFSPEEITLEFLRQALFNKLTRFIIIEWVENGFINSSIFGVDFLISLAYKPEWEKSKWIQELISKDIENNNEKYYPEFDDYLSQTIFSWLSDIRKFSPTDIGFELLIQLVKSKEENYHKFASNYMIKAFIPSDFAVKDKISKKESKENKDIVDKVDLNNKTFLFTGKLKTMTRSESEDKVKNANGKNASGVNKNLDYLVIGDDGSPLYGAGKKGSKQLAAESLIKDGAKLKIISETAFLQMLVGRSNDSDKESVESGCETLWKLVTEKGSENSPLRLFAIEYIRYHHQDIYPLITERFVDPGAEIPHSFFTFERLLPLFKETRHSLVSFALEIAEWEASKWSPDFKDLLNIFENGHLKVREFFSKALTCGSEKEHEKYKLPKELLKADYVYRLCESNDSFTKNLGMKLLKQNPELSEPESLFRLTESTDPKIRHFSIEIIWNNYKDKGISENWKNSKNKETKILQDKKNSTKLADSIKMKEFLRRMLYETPPGRTKSKHKSFKTLPSSKSKVALVEIYRKIALDDKDFAILIIPILKEFMNSKGIIEERTCLVALARISQKYPDLINLKGSV